MGEFEFMNGDFFINGNGELSGFIENVGAEYPPQDRSGRHGAVRQGAAVEQMVQHPRGFLRRRVVGFEPREDVELRELFRAPKTEIKRTGQPATQRLGRGVHILRTRERADELLVVLRGVAEGAGLEQRGDEADVFAVMGVGEVARDHQHLFGMTGRELRRASGCR